MRVDTSPGDAGRSWRRDPRRSQHLVQSFVVDCHMGRRSRR